MVFFLELNRRVLPLKDLRMDLLDFSMEPILLMQLFWEVQLVRIEVIVDYLFRDLVCSLGGLSESPKKTFSESKSSSKEAF